MVLKKKMAILYDTTNISLLHLAWPVLFEKQKRLAFLFNAFRSGFVRKIQITRVSRSN